MSFFDYLRRIGRTIVLYVWFAALSSLMYLLIDAGFLDAFRVAVREYVPLIINIVSTVFSGFAINTCLRQFAQNDETLYRAWLTEDSVSVPRFRCACKTVLKSTQFWIETVTLAAMIVLLPSAFGWRALGDLVGQYFPLKPIFQHLITSLLPVPFVFACNLSAHVSARKKWRTDARIQAMTQGKDKRRGSATLLRRLIRGCIEVSFIYGFCAYLGTMSLFAVGVLVVTVARVITWQFLVVCLSILICICLYRYLKAIRARKRFKKNLIKICREHGFTCSRFPHLYSSVFFSRQCGSFSVSANGKEYTCRIVGAVRPKNRMYIDANGCMHEFIFKLFRQPIFNLYSHTMFDFQTEENNILIVLPAPLQMIIQDGRTAREAQTGDIVGTFHLYTSQDFLGALSRDCLKR